MAKILIIDDEPLVRKTARVMLELAGHSVVEAVDGCEGMNKFGLEKFDLVITDILMPNQDGLETLASMRDGQVRTPVLAMSGGGRAGNQEFLKIAKAFGADDILPKPFSTKSLVEKVNLLCTRQSGVA